MTSLLTPAIRHPLGSPVALTLADDDGLASRPRRDATLRRVRHGVYAASEDWERLRPWERYLARVHAVALRSPDAIFCLESAAALLGLPIFGEPKDVHLFDTQSERTHRVGDILHHTSLVPPTIDCLGAVHVVSPAETTCALAQFLPPAFGLAVVDAAISARSGQLTTLAELDAVRERTVDPRGIRRLRWAITAADPAAESTGESVSRAVISWLGFADPELQREFRFEGQVDRVDFCWPGVRVVGESDGWGKYGLDTSASARDALVAEKRREDRLRRHGLTVARWEWADVMQVHPLDRNLEASGVPRLRTRQHAQLQTLRHNPRSR